MLIPCIDLQNGQAVQLVHGRKRELAVKDVFGLLERFAGYEWLHVIDLDAAMRLGSNAKLVRELCVRARKQKMKVRAGGGIRTVRKAALLAKLGVTQVIVGSAAFRGSKVNRGFLARLARRVGKRRVVIALDTAQGKIVVRGWRESVAAKPEEVMKEFEPYCGGFLCTDVDREGTMGGANLEWFAALRSATKLPIIAAGGVTTQQEIRALEKMGMDAAVGMALYRNIVR